MRKYEQRSATSSLSAVFWNAARNILSRVLLSTNLRCRVSFHEPSLNALSKFSQTDLLWTSHSLNLLDDSKHSWVLSINTLHCFWDNDCPEVCHQFLKINHNTCHEVSIMCESIHSKWRQSWQPNCFCQSLGIFKAVLYISLIGFTGLPWLIHWYFVNITLEKKPKANTRADWF